jgi:hypothetical protein
MKNLNTEIEANATVELLGYYSKGDGGGGTFYWDSTSIEDDNGGTIIEATGVVDGRWIRNYSGAVNVKLFGAIGDGVADDTTAVQAALDSGYDVFIPDGIFCVAGSLYVSSNQRVFGTGTIKGINPTTPNTVLVRIENKINVKWEVNIDTNQTDTTVTADNKVRYSIFISNSRYVYVADISIINSRVGYPIYVTGTSSNGIDPDTTGSKHIFFDNVTVDGLETDQADGGDVNQLIFKSDIYTPDDGGVYFGSSNAVKLSDYTIDETKTYPATTEYITVSNCTFINCDRVSPFNIKNSNFVDNTLIRFGYRGYNCSPTCENVHINGGSIDGAYAASVNFGYASKNCTASDIHVNPIKYATAEPTYGEGSTFRVLYGCEDCHITNITGMGGHKRQAWIIGSKRVVFSGITLKQHIDGGSDNSLVISAGVNAHNVVYETEDIQVTDCKFESEIGIVLNGDFTSTASYANNAIVVKNCDFNAKTTLVSCLSTGQADITNAMSVFYSVFRGVYKEFVGFNETFLASNIGNVWGKDGTATFNEVKLQLSVLPDDVLIGHRFTVVNGDTNIPSGASNQGVLETIKTDDSTGYRKFISQTYTEIAGSGVHPARFWKRHGSSSSNAWTGWYKYEHTP